MILSNNCKELKRPRMRYDGWTFCKCPFKFDDNQSDLRPENIRSRHSPTELRWQGKAERERERERKKSYSLHCKIHYKILFLFVTLLGWKAITMKTFQTYFFVRLQFLLYSFFFISTNGKRNYIRKRLLLLSPGSRTIQPLKHTLVWACKTLVGEKKKKFPLSYQDALWVSPQYIDPLDHI